MSSNSDFQSTSSHHLPYQTGTTDHFVPPATTAPLLECDGWFPFTPPPPMTNVMDPMFPLITPPPPVTNVDMDPMFPFTPPPPVTNVMDPMFPYVSPSQLLMQNFYPFGGEHVGSIINSSAQWLQPAWTPIEPLLPAATYMDVDEGLGNVSAASPPYDPWFNGLVSGDSNLTPYI